MDVQDWLDQVAEVEADEEMYCEVYRSKFDGSYITHVGLEDDSTLKFLAEHGVTDELTHGVGFSPSEQKWYGWSHRAIYGFGVGSTCTKGDCHYRAADLQGEIEKAISFWSGEGRENVTAFQTAENSLSVEWTYATDPEAVPNEKIRGTISGVEWSFDPNNYGRGEWAAETLEDAKQMAKDFCEGVS